MFNKLKSCYWFNFLALGGWCLSLVFLKFLIANLTYMGSGAGDIILFEFTVLLILSVLVCVIAFFVYLAEKVFVIAEIKSNFFSNKFVNILQISGIIFLTVPLIIAGIIIIFLLLEVIKNKFI